MKSQADLRGQWDQITELVTLILGGNTHFGYWEDPGNSGDINAATDRLTDLIAQRLGVGRGARVLDIGCGSGRPAARVASLTGAHVDGVTSRLAQYTVARSLDTGDARTSFHHCPLEELRFPDNTFDGAFILDTLLYEKNRAKVVAEAARVLAPGGRLVIADICLTRPSQDHAAEVETHLAHTFGLAPLPHPADFYELLNAVDMTSIAIEDVGEHVRPTYAAIAAGLHTARGFPAEAAARLATAARLLEEFGALPSTGYALVTATSTVERI